VGSEEDSPPGGPVHDRHHFEALFASGADPWKYDTPYEQTKYRQTLDLLPPGGIGRALELACAEGHLTVQLAPRAGTLVAADISALALARAAERCAGHRNVEYVRLDLAADPLPGRFDVILCGEVLYFMGDREKLEAVARKLAAALEPDGHLLLTHANIARDEPEATGFDWDMPFGAKVIGETFAGVPSLRFARELRTPLYRIQLFQRVEARETGAVRSLEPETVVRAEPAPPEPKVAASILWGGRKGGRAASRESPPAGTRRLPILTYHRVAPAASAALAPYNVKPEDFERQLRYLADNGFHSVSLERWRAAAASRRPLPGRAVLITFDDGLRDFLTHAWPALRRHGFTATVFLVAGLIGDSNRWDSAHGERVPLLDWDEIRHLRDEGADFGSHSTTHRPLTRLPVAEVVAEAARSRATLEQGLERPVTAFSYPYGEFDGAVQHLVGACGYVFGLSTRSRLCDFHDPLLALPRIEVTGSGGMDRFIGGLNV
jgi:peptidoglycan/xylan/chitin deacetylase (PgdA/CDA1 family)/SAM-dependent methyltransferase